MTGLPAQTVAELPGILNTLIVNVDRVVVGVTSGHDRTHAAREGVKDRGAGLAWLRRNPSKTWLGVSLSMYQSKSIGSTRPGSKRPPSANCLANPSSASSMSVTKAYLALSGIR